MSYTATPREGLPSIFKITMDDGREFDVSVAVDESEIPALVDFHLNPPPYTAPEPPVPEITKRQLRLWLVRNGIALATVEAAIDAMPEPARTEAQIEWNDASVYSFSNPLVMQIGAAIGLTDTEMLKQAFRDAALI